MKAEIITIGTEIMLGSILNSNSQYLTKELTNIGIDVVRHTSIQDNLDIAVEEIKASYDRSDIVIITGGLGPTDDDLTREAASLALGLDLFLDVSMYASIHGYFTRMNRTMSPNNAKQAQRLSGSSFMLNELGTAPGILLRESNKILALLPGPPKELIPMFENNLLPILHNDSYLLVKSVNLAGIGESDLEMKLKALKLNYKGFTLATYAKSGSVEIKIIGKGDDQDYLKSTECIILDTLNKSIGEFIYGYDNTSLEQEIINILTNHNKTLAVCESFTGGNISQKLTSIPGASKVFDTGLITYSNLSKSRELHIEPVVLEADGAVNENIAVSMAEAMLNKSGTDYSISTTGIAGPSSEKNKPVGLAYIAIASKTKSTEAFKLNITGSSRIHIQDRGSISALRLLLNYIKNSLT